MSDSSKKDRVTGVVKFFNYSRGYGFIKRKGDDHFVHVTNIRNGDVLLEDEEVQFKPVSGDDGLQAVEVERLDPPSMEKQSGVVKFFLKDKAYGFIDRPGMADVFFHETDVDSLPEGQKYPEEGCEAEFFVQEGRDGRSRAYRVTIVDSDEEEVDREDS